MLTEAEAAQLLTVLTDAERRLLASARQALELSMAETDSGRDSIDQSSSEELISTALRLRDREKKLLNKIRKAVDRIEQGTIDECEDCGEPIRFKRLLARPVTTQCISCKESAEEEEKRSGTVVEDEWTFK